MIEITPLQTRQDKRSYIKYVNKFRKEYFANHINGDASAFDIETVNYGLENKIVMCLIQLNNKCIGIVEATPGSIYGQKILNIATIYVDKKHRSRGIANIVYKFFSELLDDVDIALHIEESNFNQNVSKFIDMGFTHYLLLEECDSIDFRKYDEKTYVLYDKKHTQDCIELVS